MQVHHEWDKIWALDYNSVAESSFQSQEAQFFLPKSKYFGIFWKYILWYVRFFNGVKLTCNPGSHVVVSQ